MREITFKIEEKQDGLMIRDFLRNFGVSSALLTKLKRVLAFTSKSSRAPKAEGIPYDKGQR